MHSTSHAKVRRQQRGISERTMELVWKHADVEKYAGGGRYRRSISDRELDRLVFEGELTPRIAERCKRVELIEQGNLIITNYRKNFH